MTLSWKAVALLLVLLCAAPASPASDLRGTRIESLRGDLQSLRRRAERAPRASVFELKQLQRRLAEQRALTPHDPRLARLELQRRHDQWQAERVLRRGRADASRARLAGVRDQLAAPGHLRAATDLDMRGAALPVGTGKLFLFVQSGLSGARAALGRGQPCIAAGHLERVESGYRALRSVAHADDPNLAALAAELLELRAALGVAGRG